MEANAPHTSAGSARRQVQPERKSRRAIQASAASAARTACTKAAIRA